MKSFPLLLIVGEEGCAADTYCLKDIPKCLGLIDSISFTVDALRNAEKLYHLLC